VFEKFAVAGIECLGNQHGFTQPHSDPKSQSRLVSSPIVPYSRRWGHHLQLLPTQAAGSTRMGHLQSSTRVRPAIGRWYPTDGLRVPAVNPLVTFLGEHPTWR
jgi:hypothetical protein